MKRITVVVPMYGDIDSLTKCIQSLIDYAPRDLCDVLLVNDCGPEVESIEQAVKLQIQSLSNFRYVRNSENLGFVKTCNKAVFELDLSSNEILLLNSDTEITSGALEEMLAVLDLSEHHGVVCPRSNDATIASMPILLSDSTSSRSASRTRAIFDKISSQLPRYYVAPVAVGFCFLVKRSLISNHGFFDEIFGKGYNEENDFCIRVNELGYSSLIANHALVFHVGGASFGTKTKYELEATNSAILNQRYGYYPHVVANFVHHKYPAIDRFADLLVPQDNHQPKILIDLHHISLVMNGSTRNALSFLTMLSTLDSNIKSRITVAAQREAIDELNLDDYGIRTIPYLEINEIFDVGVAIAPVTSLGQLFTLNRYCLKWVISFLDIITLRAHYLDIQVPYKSITIETALNYADRILAISQSTVDDAKAFFQNDNLGDDRIVIVRQGTDDHFKDVISSSDSSELSDTAPYVLLVGNVFAHKQSKQALFQLSQTEMKVIALTSLDYKDQFPDITFIESGTQNDETVISLYKNASCVIFPSVYEGFGLPLAESAAVGTPIIAFRTETTLEVINALGLKNVFLIEDFSELPHAIELATSTEIEPQKAIRTMADYNRELFEHIQEVSFQKVNPEMLIERDQEITRLTRVGLPLEAQANAARKELADFQKLRSYKLAEQISDVANKARRAKRRIR